MKNYIYILIAVAGLAACTSTETESDAYGSLEATELFISAELPGKILYLGATEGALINPSDLLVIQDTQSLHLNKQQILASMRAIKSQLQDIPVQMDVLKNREQILAREIQRIEPLVSEGAATSKQLDDLKGEYDVVRKQIKATRSQLSTANQAILAQIEPMEWQLKSIGDQIDKASIYAPQKGTILKRYKEVGEYAGPGVPLYKLADVSVMTARVYVTGNQLSEINLGQTVKVLTDGVDESLLSTEGEITWIADEAEFTPKTIQTREERVNLVYAVKISVPNQEGKLKIGMPVEIQF